MSEDVTVDQQMRLDLEKAQRNLLDTSRMAGMAEVATGVLHNVGNVLTSLNVSANVIATTLHQSKAESLAKVSALLDEHTGDLAAFLTHDPKGKKITDFIESLARHSLEEQQNLLKEVTSLQENIDHIKEIVTMQQAYATMVGVVEPLDPVVMMEDAVRMNAGALVRHDVSVVREFHPTPRILAEKAKVLQILVNLIRNAKYAADEGGASDKIITLRIQVSDTDPSRVRLMVQDNGIGIRPENLPKIFTHGFTTRAEGHGFGLHSSANVAKDLNGALLVHSDGIGLGASFTLELPVAPKESYPVCPIER
jgi:signal transduction histidine kinase